LEGFGRLPPVAEDVQLIALGRVLLFPKGTLLGFRVKGLGIRV
jgi:hypothetical protein